jgi:hypothetical protein
MVAICRRACLLAQGHAMSVKLTLALIETM